MALSMLAQLKHRQLLYNVSTRLSQENIKDMMYLAGIEERLQEAISSGTDFFTILERRGLLGKYNYTHLISLLETVGRIDLIKTVCSDHQASAVVALPPDKFSVAEQLTVMKRAQILQKRELYLRSMQKLSVLYESTSIHQQIFETFFSQILSLLQISEADVDLVSLQQLSEQTVYSMLTSVSLFCTSATNTFFLQYRAEDSREFECQAMLCRQHWNEFCANVPTGYTSLTNSLERVHSMEYKRDHVIGQVTKETHDSLQEIFSELLGSHDLLTALDTSFNELVTNVESSYNILNYSLLFIKWLMQLIQAVEQGHINRKNIQDIVLMFASNHRQGIVDNMEQLAKILGQDFLDEILALIPSTHRIVTISQKNAQALNSHMNRTSFGLLYSTCLSLLVKATMLDRSRSRLKSVLPILHKTMIADKERSAVYSIYKTKQLLSSIQSEALMYKSKCIEIIKGGSPQSGEILKSLL